MSKSLLLLPLLLLFAQLSLANPQQEIVNLLDGFHDDAANARFDAYFGRFATEAYFLGTDATERWSVEQFREYARDPFQAGKGWRYDVVERHIRISDDIAWFDEQLDNLKLGRCRGTGVIIRQDGKWKIAHYSLTMLIPNQIAEQVGALSMAKN